MSIPILRHAGATINLTRLVESFNKMHTSAGTTASTATFYVLDLPASPCVDLGTWFRSMFDPPAWDPTIIAPAGVCDVVSRTLPKAAVYAYDPHICKARLWKPVGGENGRLRNVDRYRTAKEAFDAFEAMCLAQRCSKCRFYAPWTDLKSGCCFLWLYGEADKENAK